jgi:hypothetical protein
VKHIITFSCLIAAIALYIVGSVPGATVFFIAGLFAEMAFWIRLFQGEENE